MAYPCFCYNPMQIGKPTVGLPCLPFISVILCLRAFVVNALTILNIVLFGDPQCLPHLSPSASAQPSAAIPSVGPQTLKVFKTFRVSYPARTAASSRSAPHRRHRGASPQGTSRRCEAPLAEHRAAHRTRRRVKGAGYPRRDKSLRPDSHFGSVFQGSFRVSNPYPHT